MSDRDLPAVGPFRTAPDRRVTYVGNALFPPSDLPSLTAEGMRSRTSDLATDPSWGALSAINAAIFSAAVEFFEGENAQFVPLPLVTRMISSPGAVYGTYKLDYTSDTTPIRLRWFDLPDDVFLSESSQIYLELALLQDGVDRVFSIYNSFRKELSDATHLAEFHHIEFEGVVDQQTNVDIAERLVLSIVTRLVERQSAELGVFLRPEQLRALEDISGQDRIFHRMTLEEAFELLLKDTGDPRYEDFTMQNRFGRWEEVRLTELCGGAVAVSGFPLFEVPFYHAEVHGKSPRQADNTDLIWGGYAETVGTGRRIGDVAELEQKAEDFNLPCDDYEPYLRSRRAPSFRRSSGFGLGWERLVQGLLCLPAIWLACPFPRTHHMPLP